jgi:enolase-phosphatase E1
MKPSKNSVKDLPPLIQLKSIIIGNGLAKGEITTHVYDDIPTVFESWTTKHGIKVYLLSTAPVEGQLAFFAHTIKGDLTHYITNGISTTHPLIAVNTSDPINYRNMAKKIIQEEADNILFLTDKVKEAQALQKMSFSVVLIKRDNAFGHTQITEELLEELQDCPIASSLDHIEFVADA